MDVGLTSWPGRWTRLRISWQTRPLSPEPSLQSTPSRHHPLWHQGSLRRRRSAPQLCTGTNAGQRQRTGTDVFFCLRLLLPLSMLA